MVTSGNPSQYTYSVPYAKILWFCLAVIIISSVVYLILRILALRDLLHQKTVFLELTPPAFAKKTPMATEQLFNTLYTLGLSMPLRDRLNLRSHTFSFEVVSSRSQGIRYLVRLSKSQRATFQQQLAAYLPDVRFQIAKDYIPKTLEANESISLMEFTQGRHYAYPLASHDVLTQHDPIAYITGSMTKLQPDELIAFQIVLSPAQPREARNIRNKLLAGKSPSLTRKVWSWPLRLIRFVFRLTVGILWGILETITGTGGKHASQPTYSAQAPTPAAQAVIDSVHGKLSQPLFRASIRAVVITDDNTRRAQSTKAIASSLGAFGVPGYQSLITKRRFPNRLLHPYRWLSFRNRLPALLHNQGLVLAVSEVASLYHFPYGDTGHTENTIRSLSRTLPATASLKHSADSDGFDVVLGKNQHHGSTTPIGLTQAERERHIYIIGGTGNGKTTMLQYAIVQDMKAGKGLAVVDPHGDLADTVLRHIPIDRIKDVIYFKPRDVGYPIGLNLMELPEGLSEDELVLEQDFITEAIISVFRKTFSEDDTGGHRIEYVLRNTIHTAFTVPDATIFTLYDLLTDKTYRNSVTSKLTDRRLKNFWDQEFAKAGSFQQVKMASGVTNKLGRFERSASVKRIMEQAHSTIDFDDIINSGKILICNFAKGDIGEDTSELFGIAVLAKLQLAAHRRSQIKQSERRPFYLYVDEFQNFATMSFVQLLSEARKYKLFLAMAEQSTAQQAEQRMVDIILDNVGTVVCFRAASPANERYVLPLFTPSIDSGEIASLPAYSFYIRIAALKVQEPMSGETVLLEDEGSEAVAEQVIESSREHYAIKYKAPVAPKTGKVKTTKPKQQSSKRKSVRRTNKK
jgi:hypothetical protein